MGRLRDIFVLLCLGIFKPLNAIESLISHLHYELPKLFFSQTFIVHHPQLLVMFVLHAFF